MRRKPNSRALQPQEQAELGLVSDVLARAPNDHDLLPESQLAHLPIISAAIA